MNNERRKALKEQYLSRKITGGIYRIINKINGRFYLRDTDDMQATRNWFGSCRTFGSCFLPPIQTDWNQYGPDFFILEELDLLEKKETQTIEEFREDLKVLLALWDEKLPKDNRY